MKTDTYKSLSDIFDNGNISARGINRSNKVADLFSNMCFIRAQLMHYHVNCKTPPARQITAKFADMIGEATEFASESWQGWYDLELPEYQYPKLLWDKDPWKYLKDTSGKILDLEYKVIPDKDSPVHLAIQEVLKIMGEAMFHLKGLH